MTEKTDIKSAKGPGDIWDNPLGTDGFEFVEYSTPDPAAMAALFERLGFRAVAKHRSKAVTLFRQGDINFILNDEPDSHTARFADVHGPCVCAIELRVKDAGAVYAHALAQGVRGVPSQTGPMELNIPAIEGIGGALVYLVDRYGDGDIYEIDFRSIEGADQHQTGYGLSYIDHLTQNVYQGNMEEWAGCYEWLFNFKEVRFFDIEGKLTGLKSKAMTSPCGKIRIPINESTDNKSQIVEFLEQYNGEGIQHVALGTGDIFATVEAMLPGGVAFMNTPDTYFEGIDARLPGHEEDVDRLYRNKILIDSAPADDQGLLLQIFTDTVIGPIFFEIIQRKGNEGFGEDNFQALFDSIEADQVRRGVLEDKV